MQHNKLGLLCGLCGIGLLLAPTAYSMGLRSLVALPVEKHGGVARLTLEHDQTNDTSQLVTNLAYGIDHKQTLLFGLGYRVSPGGADQLGDGSLLYRRVAWQDDELNGTNRFSWLAGAILPTQRERDSAAQAGLVFTHFRGRHEVDLDAVYQVGFSERPDNARYDASWQYRLSPSVRPSWGTPAEINTVLEFNGRWQSHSGTSRQVTAGLQWIHPQWVLEGGIVKELNRDRSWNYLISTRLHW